MIKIVTFKNKAEWNDIVHAFANHDVYYSHGYVEAFMLHGDGAYRGCLRHRQRYTRGGCLHSAGRERIGAVGGIIYGAAIGNGHGKFKAL